MLAPGHLITISLPDRYSLVRIVAVEQPEELGHAENGVVIGYHQPLQLIATSRPVKVSENCLSLEAVSSLCVAVIPKFRQNQSAEFCIFDFADERDPAGGLAPRLLDDGQALAVELVASFDSEQRLLGKPLNVFG